MADKGSRLLNWQGNLEEPPPRAADYQQRQEKQVSPCRQGLNLNRRLRASRVHHHDGRPLLASPQSIFRTTAWSPPFCLCTFSSSASCTNMQKHNLFILNVLIKSLHATECFAGAVTLRVNYADEEQTPAAAFSGWTIKGKLRVSGSLFKSRTAGVLSVPPLWLSDWSCSNKSTHLV